MMEDITIARTSQHHGKKLFPLSPPGASARAPYDIHLDLRWGIDRRPGSRDRFLFQHRTLIRQAAACPYLVYGATQTTKLNSASLYLPVTFQQPRVGKSTPVSMAEPISLA